jgi:hypothetical protein
MTLVVDNPPNYSNQKSIQRNLLNCLDGGSPQSTQNLASSAFSLLQLGHSMNAPHLIYETGMFVAHIVNILETPEAQ